VYDVLLNIAETLKAALFLQRYRRARYI